MRDLENGSWEAAVLPVLWTLNDDDDDDEFDIDKYVQTKLILKPPSKQKSISNFLLWNWSHTNIWI